MQGRELCLDSPFDYATQARSTAPRGLPDPNDAGLCQRRWPSNSSRWWRRPAAACWCCAPRCECCSRSVRACASSSYPVWTQGEASKAQLLERFAGHGNGVLVATNSFWEGVDVKGQALRVVAIDRLPFPPPGDPVFEARLSLIREAGGNPFTELQLPRMITALRQGIGRLIRDSEDRGVVVLLDPRLFHKSYGRMVSCQPARRSRALAT